MSSILWQLEFAGDRRTLKDWGLTNARIRRKNFAPDEFLADRASPAAVATADPLFSYGSEFVIYRGDVCWFRGRVPHSPSSASGAQERQSLIAWGAFADLGRVTYEQLRKHSADSEDPEALYVNIETSSVVLFQNLAETSMSLDEQVTEAIQFAIDAGAPLAIGTIEPVFNVPWEEASDISCETVLRRAYRWAPDAATRIDYTTNPPTLHIRRRADLTAASVAATALESFRVAARPDIAPAGVKIYIRRIRVWADGVLRINYETQTAGTVTGVGVMVFTLKPGTADQPVPANLATQFYSTLSTLQWEGEVTMREQEVTGAISVGNVLNITGGHSDWSTMNALVQEVEYALDAGTTTARFGPPHVLGISDLISLLNANRNTRPPTGDPEERPTGDPILNFGFKTRSLTLCDGEIIGVLTSPTTPPP